MKRLIEFMEMITPALDAGVRVSVYKDSEGRITIDLDTRGKSFCIVKIEDDEFVAYRRYDRVDTVRDFSHLVTLVHDCCHRRGFFNDAWIPVFRDEFLEDPRGNL